MRIFSVSISLQNKTVSRKKCDEQEMKNKQSNEKAKQNRNNKRLFTFCLRILYDLIFVFFFSYRKCEVCN